MFTIKQVNTTLWMICKHGRPLTKIFATYDNFLSHVNFSMLISREAYVVEVRCIIEFIQYGETEANFACCDRN